MGGGARRVRRPLPWLVAALGGALVVVGLTLFDIAAWFVDSDDATVVYSGSYGPLPDDTVVMWTARQLAGLGLTALGLLLLTGLGGWLLGSRASSGRAARPER
jgi:hypothetical protein